MLSMAGVLPQAVQAGTWDDQAGDNLWTSAANWDPDGLQAGQAVIFGDVGTAATAGTVTSRLDGGGTLTISSLRFQQNGAALFHTLEIAAGTTLRIDGANSLKLGVGSYATTVGTVNGAQTRTTITGGGSLIVDNTAGIIDIGIPTVLEGVANTTVLDMAGLGAFEANVNELRIAWGRDNAGTLTLSNTSNQITANAIQVSNTSGQNSDPGLLVLGAGVNVLRASEFNLGVSKGDGTIRFASQATGSAGTVVIGGKTVGSAANLTLGVATDGTGFSPVGLLDLRGHQAEVTAGNIVLGRRGGDNGGAATGTIRFNQGTFTVNNLTLGVRQQGVAGTGGKATGTLEVGGGVFTVNAGGSIVLGTRLGTLGTTTAEGVLTISGGVFETYVDIQHGGGVGASAVINLTGGTLDMKGNRIGSATNRVATLNFQSGTLRDVAEINGGETGLTKSGGGTLILEGNNTYTGGTTINSGTLQVGTGGTTGTLGTGDISISDGTLAINRSDLVVVADQFSGYLGILQQMGSGRTVLTGDNSDWVASLISVTGGILEAANVNALGSQDAASSFTPTLVVSSGAEFHFKPEGAPQTLQLIGLTLDDGSTVGVRLGDRLNSSGSALVTGDIQLKLFGNAGFAPTTGSYNVLTAGGGLDAADYSLMLYNNTNFTAVLNPKTANAISVTATAVAELGQAWWVGGRVTGHGSEWAVSDGTTSNWATNVGGTSTAVVPGAGTDVFISATGGSSSAMTLGADMLIGSLTILDTGAVNLTDIYTLGIAKNNAITKNAGSGATNLNVGVDLLGAAPVVVVNSTNALTLSGPLGGANGYAKRGTGTLILSGTAANTNTGTTTVEDGTLELAKTAGVTAVAGDLVIGAGTGVDRVLLRASEQIADDATVTINTNGLLVLNGFNETVGALNGTGAVENTVTGSPSVFAVGGGGGDGEFSGVIRNGGAGPVLSLNKIGSGTQILSGSAANTYSGVTTVLGGVLALNKTAGVNAIGGNLVLGDGTQGGTARLLASHQIGDAATLTVNGGGTFDLNGNVETVAGVTLNGGDIVGEGVLTSTSEYLVRSGTASATLAGDVGLRKDVGGTVILSGDNTYTGVTNVQGLTGILRITSDFALGSLGQGTRILANNTNGVTLELANNIFVQESLVLEARQGDIVNNASLRNHSGYNVWAGNIRLDFGGSNYNIESAAGVLEIRGNITGGTINGTGRNIKLFGAGDGVISGALDNGTAGASVNIEKYGTGTWVITGNTAHAGTTVVTAGTLRVQNSTALAASSRLSVAGGATFHYQSGSVGNNLSVNALTLSTNSRIGAEVGNAIAVGAGGVTATTGAVTLDLFGVPGFDYTNPSYDVITNAGTGSLASPTYTLGNVYNATNFTVDTSQGTGGISKTATAVTVHLLDATELTTAYWKGGFAGGANVWAISNGTTQSNWASDINGTNTPLVPGANTNVIFSANGADPAHLAAMELGVSMAVGTLTFNGTDPVLLDDLLNQLTLNGANAITVNGTGPVNLTTGLILADAAPIITVAADGSLTLGWEVTGTDVTKAGAGTLLFSGAADNILGGTFTVAGGTLLLGKDEGSDAITGSLLVEAGAVVRHLASEQINDATDVTLDAGAELDLNGNQESFDELTGTGTVTNSGAGDAVLTLGAGDGDFTFTGEIEDGTGGMALTKDGTGTMVLGSQLAYTGLTTVLDGVLRYGVNDALGATNDLRVDGATAVFDLDVYSGTLGTVTLANGTITGQAVAVLTSDTSFELMNGLVSARLAGTAPINKTTAGTVTLTAQSTHTGDTFIKEGTFVIGVTDALPTNSRIFIGEGGLVGHLQLPSSSQTVAGLQFLSTTTAEVNTVTIGAGQTLTVNGTDGLKVGPSGTFGIRTHASISGGGTLEVNNVAANFDVGFATASPDTNPLNTASLDMSGLSAFEADVNEFRVGYGLNIASTLTLAANNTIQANIVRVADSEGWNAQSSLMILGSDFNVIKTDTFNIGVSKAIGTVRFASSTPGSPGTVEIGGKTGAEVDITVGATRSSDGTSSTPTGTLDLRGHTATVVADTLVIGRRDGRATAVNGGGGATGTVYFDGGEFSVNTLDMANKAATGTEFDSIGVAQATLNVSGGTFTVNEGGTFYLARQAGKGTAVGTLNLTGGEFISHADIQDGGGAATTTITLDGGKLDLVGNEIGSAANHIDTLNFLGGVLANVDKINGTGGVTKTGAGKTLKLEGTNAYTGATLVTAGTFLVNGTHTGGAGYTVNAGTTLGGGGNITLAANQNVSISGLLAVGDSTLPTAQAATLTVTTSGTGALVFEDNSFVEFDLITSGTGGLNSSDLLDINGNLQIGTDVTLNIANPNNLTNWAFGDTWQLFDWTGVTNAPPAEGAFDLGSSFDDILSGTGFTWDFTDLYTGGTISIVPEPGRAVLILLGAGAMLLRRRRNRALSPE